MPNQINRNGGGGGFPGGGPAGGSPTGAGQQTTPAQINLVQSVGGVLALTKAAVWPCVDLNLQSEWFYSFDPAKGFNDPLNARSHSFRVEEMEPSMIPTIRALALTYRDMGLATTTFTIEGSLDSGALVNTSKTEVWGTPSPAIPSFKLFTRLVYFGISCLNPQLTVSQEANAGSLSIAKIVMFGEIEELNR